MNLKKYNSVYYSHMRYKRLVPVIFFGSLTIVYQCSVALKMPTELDAQKNGVSLDTLVMGRRLYIENCGSCHSLYLPEKFTAAQWTTNVQNMKKRAKTNDQQSALILQYLTSSCKNENE
jgi:hypothetical protein